MAKKIKRGRDRIRSAVSKRDRTLKMSMDRAVTRRAYESREVAVEPTDPNKVKKANKAAMDKFQSTLKPIRSGQK